MALCVIMNHSQRSWGLTLFALNSWNMLFCYTMPSMLYLYVVFFLFQQSCHSEYGRCRGSRERREMENFPSLLYSSNTGFLGWHEAQFCLFPSPVVLHSISEVLWEHASRQLESLCSRICCLFLANVSLLLLFHFYVL